MFQNNVKVPDGAFFLTFFIIKRFKMKTKRIAIQGGYGAYHDIAAHYFFEGQSIEIIPRTTFKELFKSLKQQQVDYGIMAIENSLAGSILPNYALVRDC